MGPLCLFKKEYLSVTTCVPLKENICRPLPMSHLSRPSKENRMPPILWYVSKVVISLLLQIDLNSRYVFKGAFILLFFLFYFFFRALLSPWRIFYLECRLQKPLTSHPCASLHHCASGMRSTYSSKKDEKHSYHDSWVSNWQIINNQPMMSLRHESSYLLNSQLN